MRIKIYHVRETVFQFSQSNLNWLIHGTNLSLYSKLFCLCESKQKVHDTRKNANVGMK